MPKNYIKALKRTIKSAKFEFKCHLCCIVGFVKSKIVFNSKAINKLEIGLGQSIKKKNFISSDLSLSTDFPYDLRLGLPFPDNSINVIYAEHVLEHFSYKDLMNLIRDCYRVLKPHGVFSVAVPDASIYLRAYYNNDNSDFDYKEFCRYEFGLTYKSRIDFVNYIFYMDGHHQHMFDEDSLLTVLKEGGFRQARMRNFDPALDQVARQYESIYAEGVK